jgi:formylglycine-generating enzyme required for sulfatase activity
MYEWTLDLYATYANPCIDCVDATGGYYRVIRTGSFGDDKTNLVPWYRFENVSYVRNAGFGFGCARTP